MSTTINQERKDIISRYKNLLHLCKPFLNADDLKTIRTATELVLEIYKDERDSNNEPYVYLPLEIASIVVEEIGLATTAIVCSLLYQPVWQNKITIEEIREKFGDNVVRIILDLNKISETSENYHSLQSDNLRKFLLSLASDVRVLLIHLAIKLYKLRNIDLYPPKSRERIALEASYLFSPLAHRLGLYNIKGELDDLAMKITQPSIYLSIHKKLEETQHLRSEFVNSFIKPIEKSLFDAKLKFDVKWRTKRVHSVYRKMKTQQVDFEEVMDTFAIRIILDSKEKNEKSDCWRTYSLITDVYPPNPKRLRDWISIPKSSGYESLHTTVMSPIGRWVEIQIRTRRMDEIAEKGFAAHWKYKGENSESQLDQLLNSFREVLEDSNTNALDVLDSFKMNAYSEDVFVFTPKGDLIKLPKGATVLDFAFEIHSEVGAKCLGAKVNKRVVPLRQELKNGDQIELNLGKNQKPKQDWLSFVHTAKAKARIKKELNEIKLKQAEEGKDTVKRKFRNWKIQFTDTLINKILKQYKYKSAIDFYHEVAHERIDLLEVKHFILQPEKETEEDKTNLQSTKHTAQKKNDLLLFEDNSFEGLNFRMAKCCQPLEGDSIIGFVTLSGEVSIHRKTCSNAIRMSERYGYREISVKWSQSVESYQEEIRIIGNDRVGLMSDISSEFHKDLKINLRSINLEAKDKNFEGVLKIVVEEFDHVDVLIQRLNKIKGVIKVSLGMIK